MFHCELGDDRGQGRGRGLTRITAVSSPEKRLAMWSVPAARHWRKTNDRLPLAGIFSLSRVT
jgi:hypothetical protein